MNSLIGVSCVRSETENTDCRMTSHRAAFRLMDKAFQQAGPAAIDVLAHRSAGFRAHGFEFVMPEFDQRGVRSVGAETHVDFRFHGGGGFPLRVDLPDHHQAMRWLPKRDGGNTGLPSVFRDLQPTSTQPQPPQAFLNRFLADPRVVPPAPPAARPKKHQTSL